MVRCFGHHRSTLMKKIFATAGLAAALIWPALGASAQNKPADKASQKFIAKAVEGNLAEVQIGQLAQEKASSDGVRSFGQMLQQDHSAAAQSSSAVASQIGVTPPSEPNRQQKALHQ